MKLQTLLGHCILGVATAVALTLPFSAGAGSKAINVGVIFDYSGKLVTALSPRRGARDGRGRVFLEPR